MLSVVVHCAHQHVMKIRLTGSIYLILYFIVILAKFFLRFKNTPYETTQNIQLIKTLTPIIPIPSTKPTNQSTFIRAPSISEEINQREAEDLKNLKNLK